MTDDKARFSGEWRIEFSPLAADVLEAADVAEGMGRHWPAIAAGVGQEPWHPATRPVTHCTDRYGNPYLILSFVIHRITFVCLPIDTRCPLDA